VASIDACVATAGVLHAGWCVIDYKNEGTKEVPPSQPAS
jgi:hypothetical protein